MCARKENMMWFKYMIEEHKFLSGLQKFLVFSVLVILPDGEI